MITTGVMESNMKVKKDLILQKLERQYMEIGAMRFIEMQDIFPFDAMDDKATADHIHTTSPEEVRQYKVEKNEAFVGRDRYLWMRKRVIIPPAREGCRPVGLFDFGKTGGGQNSGFESLLYVDRKPYQGVDSNHKDVMFDDYAGKDVELTFMLWTGLEGGGPKRNMEHRLRMAEVGLLHEATDTLYYLLKAIVDSMPFLSRESYEREKLIDAAEAALAELDWDEDAFHASVPAALAAMKTRLDAVAKNSQVRVNCVGHTHIDVAWLWRLKHTREKAMRSFASVLRFMDEFDDYRFLQSQPQLYKYMKKDCPELYEKIKKRVADGHWTADGGMWLEADCNVSSGEALARQFLYGIRFFQKEFGVTCSCLWLPDVFGYSWALPQIMKQCDIRTFMTTKISWNQYNTIPNDLFVWRGIDGSEMLTYFIHTPDESRVMEDRFATYNGQLTPRTVFGSWKRFKNKELSNEVLLSYGYGDGGGGPTREMLRMQQAMDALPGLPQVKQSGAVDFFDRLHDHVANSDQAPNVWDGELYLEYHRGTYTSEANNKKENRRLENRLLETEILAVMAAIAGGTYLLLVN